MVVGWEGDLECGGKRQRDAALNSAHLGCERKIQSAVAASLCRRTPKNVSETHSLSAKGAKCDSLGQRPR
jgi:hypothetical protein